MTYHERESQKPPSHLLPRLADALKVSVDELLGHQQLKKLPPAPKHSRLWRKLRAVEKLSEADRKAVMRFIDVLLARQQLEAQRG